MNTQNEKLTLQELRIIAASLTGDLKSPILGRKLKANERLFAAAPELLAACENLVNAYLAGDVTIMIEVDGRWLDANLDNMQSAITKAKGK